MTSDYAPTPVEDFLDPDDPTLFPRLTPEQIEYLAEIGTQSSFARGDLVFEHGQRETPLYVVLSGAIDIIDQAPEGDRYFTQCREGTFAADISMFTGEPTLAAGFAAEPTSLLALPPEDVRRVVATAAELGDLLLRTMVTRREWLQGRGLGQQRLIGSRWSGEAFAVRELLERNLVPFTWHDLATDEESRVLLDGLGIGDADCPVLVRSDSVIRRATVTSVADELALTSAGRRPELRRRRPRRWPGGAGRRRLRRIRGSQHAGGRTLRPGRSGGYERSHRELPRLSHRPHRRGAQPASDAPGAQVRRRHLERPRGVSGVRAGRRGPARDPACRRSARAGPIGGPGVGCGLSPAAGRECRSIRGPRPVLRGDPHRGPAMLDGGRRRRRRRKLGRPGGGQARRPRRPGPRRRPATARVGDVAATWSIRSRPSRTFASGPGPRSGRSRATRSSRRS